MDIEEVFGLATEEGASDVHLVVGLPPVFRIDGQLCALVYKKDITNQELQKGIFSLLTSDQKKVFLRELGLDFGLSLNNGVRLRINIHHEKNNVGLVARIINEEIPSLEDIQTPEVVKTILENQQGLILITGPTGCGKSTTLAAMINYINQTRNANIVTLEDPIEFIFKPKKSIILQRQLGTDMITFNKGLKHILRQDPDIIMIGEMRDLETISAAITLAETGHLVLATLHTYSSAQTIDRIIDIFDPYKQNQIRMQLSVTLRLVLSQRLLPGLKGKRVAVREIMINNSAIANLIREHKTEQIKNAIETSGDIGMFSLNQDLKRLVNAKIISEDVAKIHYQDVI